MCFVDCLGLCLACSVGFSFEVPPLRSLPHLLLFPPLSSLPPFSLFCTMHRRALEYVGALCFAGFCCVFGGCDAQVLHRMNFSQTNLCVNRFYTSTAFTQKRFYFYTRPAPTQTLSLHKRCLYTQKINKTCFYTNAVFAQALSLRKHCFYTSTAFTQRHFYDRSLLQPANGQPTGWPVECRRLYINQITRSISSSNALFTTCFGWISARTMSLKKCLQKNGRHLRSKLFTHHFLHLLKCILETSAGIMPF